MEATRPACLPPLKDSLLTDQQYNERGTHKSVNIESLRWLMLYVAIERL